MKGRIGAAFGGRLEDGLARDLTGISARGITSLFVFSRGDGGLEYFQLHASAALRRRSREAADPARDRRQRGAHIQSAGGATGAASAAGRFRPGSDPRGPSARSLARGGEISPGLPGRPLRLVRSLKLLDVVAAGESSMASHVRLTIAVRRLLTADAARRTSERGGARWTNDFLTYFCTSQTVSRPRGKYATLPGTSTCVTFPSRTRTSPSRMWMISSVPKIHVNVPAVQSQIPEVRSESGDSLNVSCASDRRAFPDPGRVDWQRGEIGS